LGIGGAYRCSMYRACSDVATRQFALLPIIEAADEHCSCSSTAIRSGLPVLPILDALGN
jgi:hypothetical protein